MKTEDELYKANATPVIIPCGLWEEKNALLYYDHFVDEPEQTCKHATKVEYIAGWPYNGQVRTGYVFKRVLSAINEGGNSSTGICLDCLLEFLETLK